MAITKEISVDHIEVFENNCIQVRTKTAIMEDGKQISGTFSRHIVAPGDDYAAEDARVQAICAATHTADVVSAYKAAQASLAIPE
jgi:hypothetical protein